jgi:hypothetical protein
MFERSLRNNMMREDLLKVVTKDAVAKKEREEKLKARKYSSKVNDSLVDSDNGEEEKKDSLDNNEGIKVESTPLSGPDEVQM